MVAPETAAKLEAVNPAKVAVPAAPATVVVPPKVQVACTAAATTLAVLAVRLPY